jgi:structural maintenance of chromosome 4
VRRQNRLGRTTFIILDKVANVANRMQPKATPENVPRLFDLVRAQDTTILPAFYYALRDTLVAEDIEQASR